MKKSKHSFLFFIIPALFILPILFFGKQSFASTIQCEYIPRDDSRNIIYFKGNDADHRPWVKEMDNAACAAKCSSEAPTGLKFQCAVSGSIFGGLLSQNPEGCNATYTTCGEVSNPILTFNCKFTPRKNDGTRIDGAWERLTPSESECQNICDGAAGKGLCSSWCSTIGSTLCCDDAQTTCEATTNVPPAPETYQFESVTPELEIPLPTLPSLSGFTDLTLQGEAGSRYFWVPWIGQYIAAIYKYAIGIVGILSGIMIVVGGLLWLTAGGAADRISTAKSFIESSLVGLVIALTSYLLLYAINPNLVGFEGLKVKYIERIPTSEIVNNILDTTTTNTSESEVVPDTFTDCPITLPPDPDDELTKKEWTRNPRTQNFISDISTVITGTTPREKVIQIAQAAVKCGVTLGSCGKTSENINQIAGISGRGQARHEISGEQMKYLCALNCGARTGIDNPCEAVKKAGRDDIPCLDSARSVPASTKKTDVYDKFKSEIANWPDSWANELQPGDSFAVFNGNSDPPGNHTAIFMGWASEGRARVIQGAWGRLVNEGTICIKSTCSNPSPLVRTFRAE
ncbi:MAG: pilin [Patescibacteria group bacterium]|jgi:hypothetical protein